MAQYLWMRRDSTTLPMLLMGIGVVCGGCSSSKPSAETTRAPYSDSSQGAPRADRHIQAKAAGTAIDNVLPFSLDAVLSGSGFSTVEAHGLNGGGYFWEFITPDETTIVEVEGYDRLQLRSITFSILHPTHQRVLSDDLAIVQAQIDRLFPKEQKFVLSESDVRAALLAVPSEIHYNGFKLVLSLPTTGDTIVAIECDPSRPE